MPELEILTSCLEEQRPHFVAVYGRRRIGKTFLIRQAFKAEKMFIEVTGIRKGANIVQIKNFLDGFIKVANLPYETNLIPTWEKALELFTSWLEKRRTKVILFLDELPWLVGRRSKLLELIDYYWNSRWSKLNNFTLIVCGSASSWMIEKILHETGGLYNRVTKRLHLRPFNIHETESYLKNLKYNFSQQQVMELYLIFGGVPYYLNLLPRLASPTQAIDQLIYQNIGQLHEEYALLMQALFREPELHNKILSALCKNRYGLSRKALVHSTKVKDGGVLTRALEELENCDFIKGYLPFGKSKQGEYYRIIDEFTLFYNKWLSKQQKKSLKIPKNYWLKQHNTPAFHAFCGYNFESFCQKHIDEILEALGISGMAVDALTWKYHGDAQTQGTQIDLILDRADRIINLCEIKYSQIETSLNRADADFYLKRVETFKKITKTKKTVNSVLISFSGVKDNEFLHKAFSAWLGYDIFLIRTRTIGPRPN